MNGPPNGTNPILCAHLLRAVDEKLVDLLGSLAPREWDLQTIARLWKVAMSLRIARSVLRKLSVVRDSCYVEAVTIRSPQDVVALVNRLNAEGVTVYRRLSPPILIEMMKVACEQSARFHESLDPFAPATFNVGWAGEETSLKLVLIRSRTHRTLASPAADSTGTNRPGIMTPDLYYPVLDCFARGLPHVYRDVDAPAGTDTAVGDFRRMRRAMVPVQGDDTMGFRQPTSQRSRVAGDHTAGASVACLYKGHRS